MSVRITDITSINRDPLGALASKHSLGRAAPHSKHSVGSSSSSSVASLVTWMSSTFCWAKYPKQSETLNP